MDYEILNDAGEVINVIVADEDFVQANYPGKYRLRVKQPRPEDNPLKIITHLAMVSRFTDAEYVQIVSAAKTDIEMQAWYDRFMISKFIDLEDPRTIAGMMLLQSKNILTDARMSEILNAPVQPSERA